MSSTDVARGNTPIPWLQTIRSPRRSNREVARHESRFWRHHGPPSGYKSQWWRDGVIQCLRGRSRGRTRRIINLLLAALFSYSFLEIFEKKRKKTTTMAPNPNECVVVLQMSSSIPSDTSAVGQIIKIVTSDVDSTSEEDGEHFYDASSDIGGAGLGENASDESAPEENSNNKAGDSGIEDATFEMPDAQLAAQIVEQVCYLALIWCWTFFYFKFEFRSNITFRMLTSSRMLSFWNTPDAIATDSFLSNSSPASKR